MPLISRTPLMSFWEWLALLPMGGILVVIVSPLFVSHGPGGEAVPSTPPDERNRVRHDAGFSIIFPPEWKTESQNAISGGGLLGGIGGSSTRYSSTLYVHCYGRKQEPPGGIDPTWQRTTFQGQPAYRSGHPQRGRRYSEAVYFQRNGSWFTLDATVPSSVSALPPIMHDYFNTFRFVPPKPPADPFLRDEVTPPSG